MTNQDASRQLEGIGRFEWERIFERVPTGADGIKPTTKYVGFVLARYSKADTGRRIWPGRERLAAVVGKSVRTIDGALDELCDVGLIELVKKGGRGAGGKGYATEYRLTVPDDLTQQMKLLDLDDTEADLPSRDHSQPTASDEGKRKADQSQPTASDRAGGDADQSQLSADQSQLLTSSVAILDSISRNGLHPIKQLHQSTSINQGASAGYVTSAREDTTTEKLTTSFSEFEGDPESAYDQAQALLQTLPDLGQALISEARASDPALSLRQAVIRAAQTHREAKGRAA